MESKNLDYIFARITAWTDIRSKDLTISKSQADEFGHSPKLLANREHEEFLSGTLLDLAEILEVLLEKDSSAELFMNEFLKCCDYFFREEEGQLIGKEDIDESRAFIKALKPALSGLGKSRTSILTTSESGKSIKGDSSEHQVILNPLDVSGSYKLVKKMRELESEIHKYVEENSSKVKEFSNFRNANYKSDSVGTWNKEGVLSLYVFFKKTLEAIKKNKMSLDEKFQSSLEERFFIRFGEKVNEFDISEKIFVRGASTTLAYKLICHVTTSLGLSSLKYESIANIILKEGKKVKIPDEVNNFADDMPDKIILAKDKLDNLSLGQISFPDGSSEAFL